MPRMCKDRQWDSVLIPDNDPQEQDDGTITILTEDEVTKAVSGNHVKGGGSPSEITGTCDHGNPNKSQVRLRRREQRQTPSGPITVTIRYSGELNEGEDDISNGRYKVVGGLIDPDEGTWVGTNPGGDSDIDKKKKKTKAPRDDARY